MNLLIYLKKNIFLYLFFTTILIIGFLIFKDYGLYLDEDNSRENGLVSLSYVIEIFFPTLTSGIEQFTNVPNIHDYYQQGNGVVFDAPMAFFELIFNINDSRTFYLFRHFFNFIFFFTSLIFFYKIVRKRFNSLFMGVVGVLFLFFTPRIFAESFYNTKDIFFMSLFIIALFTAINFLEKKTYKSALLFALATSLMIDTRIVGIYMPILVCFFYIIDLLRDKNFTKRNIFSLLIFIFFSSIFIIIFWPFLWEQPIQNLIAVFQNLAKHDVDIYNFYLGEYVKAKNVPWHYLLVWISVTTPLFYLIFFIIGFFLIIRRFISRLLKIEENESYNDLWRGKKELHDLIYVFTFLIPLFVVSLLGSTLYDGWRHLYFIYPSFLMICLFGLNYINTFMFKKFYQVKYFIIILTILPLGYWMYQHHPNQNIFFNILVGKDFNNKFEMDYWGISNKGALEYIIKNNNQIVKITNINTSDLNLSKNILEKIDRDRIEIVENFQDADFIINNFRDWNGLTKPQNYKIPQNYVIYHEIKVDEVVINRIYKNKNIILN
tara:strand:+ start:422 stop:2062 length:1641 start_codon:yes stop_codon:yes gene_type:complete